MLTRKPGKRAEWFEELEKAAILAKRQHVLSLLLRLEEQDAALGATLASWVGRYEYQRVLDWTIWFPMR